MLNSLTKLASLADGTWNTSNGAWQMVVEKTGVKHFHSILWLRMPWGWFGWVCGLDWECEWKKGVHWGWGEMLVVKAQLWGWSWLEFGSKWKDPNSNSSFLLYLSPFLFIKMLKKKSFQQPKCVISFHMIMTREWFGRGSYWGMASPEQGNVSHSLISHCPFCPSLMI